MKNLLIILLLVLGVQTMAQKKYQPTWESIDSRPMPTWYSDAKFGIFIHWGPYSVPAFSKVGSYSEWYWNQLAKRDKEGDKNETKEFHQRVYGEDFAYPDFVPMFKCELFDPNQWANTFKESGAKYVVLTSKHHDESPRPSSKITANLWP